jgi:hypothetical protein
MPKLACASLNCMLFGVRGGCLERHRPGYYREVSTTSAAKFILIAGPYRSGTGDDPELLAQNVREMERFALPIFRASHVPVVGEWFALPLCDRRTPRSASATKLLTRSPTRSRFDCSKNARGSTGRWTFGRRR